MTISTSAMFLEHTPIEHYTLNSHSVYVKRDDMYGQYPMPPLAKLRGIKIVVEQLHKSGVDTIGVLDTRVSKSGQGVAAICHYLFPEVKLLLGFPKRKADTEIPVQHLNAQQLGAELVILQATRQSINYYQMRNIVAERHGVMLPHGLPFVQTARAVANEASGLPETVLGGTLVTCAGTGTSLAGMIAGIGNKVDSIIGVSAGKANWTQERTIREIMLELDSNLNNLRKLELVPALMDYYQKDTISCPFPAHPNYDRKVWHWLKDNIDRLKEPIIFWNIGS